MAPDFSESARPSTTWHASAPGKLMILGEYAVLEGHPAIVAAITRRITVTLEPRPDQILHIQSDLANHQTTIQDLQ